MKEFALGALAVRLEKPMNRYVAKQISTTIKLLHAFWMASKLQNLEKSFWQPLENPVHASSFTAIIPVFKEYDDDEEGGK